MSEGNGPRVTKPYTRERDARDRRTKSPREEFEAARKRGLTEEEVRGVVEVFFLELGMNWSAMEGNSIDELRVQKRKVNAYYLEALVLGFGLTDEQKRIAQKKLMEDYNELVAGFSQAMREAYQIGSDELDWKSMKIDRGISYMAWGLCRRLG